MLAEIPWSTEDLGKISKADQGELKEEEEFTEGRKGGCWHKGKRNQIVQSRKKGSAEGKWGAVENRYLVDRCHQLFLLERPVNLSTLGLLEVQGMTARTDPKWF